jgi:hypothetical protein
MSPRVLVSSLIVLAVATCLLSSIWALGWVHVSDAPGNGEPPTAVVYGDLEGPADSASLGEQADPEDADSMSSTRDVQAIATSISVLLISTERARSVRPDRPPRLALLG